MGSMDDPSFSFSNEVPLLKESFFSVLFRLAERRRRMSSLLRMVTGKVESPVGCLRWLGDPLIWWSFDFVRAVLRRFNAQ